MVRKESSRGMGPWSPFPLTPDEHTDLAAGEVYVHGRNSRFPIRPETGIAAPGGGGHDGGGPGIPWSGCWAYGQSALGRSAWEANRRHGGSAQSTAALKRFSTAARACAAFGARHADLVTGSAYAEGPLHCGAHIIRERSSAPNRRHLRGCSAFLHLRRECQCPAAKGDKVQRCPQVRRCARQGTARAPR